MRDDVLKLRFIFRTDWAKTDLRAVTQAPEAGKFARVRRNREPSAIITRGPGYGDPRIERDNAFRIGEQWVDVEFGDLAMARRKLADSNQNLGDGVDICRRLAAIALQ